MNDDSYDDLSHKHCVVDWVRLKRLSREITGKVT